MGLLLTRSTLLAALFGVLIVPLHATLRAAEPADARKNPAPDAAELLPPAVERTVDFVADVQPLLKNRCYACHGPKHQESGLRLHRRELAFRGGDGGPVIVPGKSAESRLIRYVAGLEADKLMPPDGEGERLSPEQVGILRAWIDQGAAWPASADGAVDGTLHWAYTRPQAPALPAVGNSGWPRNGLDYFVLARLERQELSPQPEADRARLLRRASLDLIGLPPTPAEVAEFQSDPRPDAYERAVDRLLASPRYGERWALPWLDLARYADTQGYEKDNRRTIWRYRDWVIEALNRDMPLDRFTLEQLAGDLLRDAGPGQLVATAFHRNTMTNTEGGTDNEEFRVAAVVDRVNTTMQVWMGTTFNCCQCHSHKYDPFTQREYYALIAILNQTEDNDESNESPTLPTPTRAEAEAMKNLRDQIARLEEEIQQQAAKENDGGDTKPDPASSPRAEELAQLKKQLAEFKPTTTPILRELPPSKQRKTHVMIRGNFLDKGDEVSPDVPAVLHPFPEKSPRDRAGLSRWLVCEENPLTARVMVNRHWEQFFGVGLVESSEDFGTQGTPPSHPELLDFLAMEFTRSGWSFKSLHRLIVTSATYRQSSRVPAELAERDPNNRLLARGPRVRLGAETVRDQALAAAGLLSSKFNGPSVMPPQPEGIWQVVYSGDKWQTSTGEDRYRRGLYTFWRRTSPYPAMVAFDAPSREFCVVRRSRTNTPLQALVTLNDPAFVEAARGVAVRAMREGGARDEDRAAYLFRLCLARAAGEFEQARLVELYRSELAHYRQNAAAANILAGNEKSPPANLDAAELAAWTVVANVVLNLDETLTKG
jgi:hypothetical protein